MTVSLDGRPVPRQPDDGQTLQGVIDAARADLGRERLIVTVMRNGRALVNDDLSTALDSTVAPSERIELSSADRYELAAAALEEIAHQLGEVGREQEAIARQLTSGQTAPAIERFSGFVTVWQTCQQTVLSCGSVLEADLTAQPHEGRPIREHLTDLAARLRELRDAFEARDMVLLADLLQYELPQLCGFWRDLLNRLAARVATRSL